MIYFYRHKNKNNLSMEEIDMLGVDGIKRFSEVSGVPFEEAYAHIKNLEAKLSSMKIEQFDMSSGANKQLYEHWVNNYIKYFNKYATRNKQAYVILGNISSGKSTLAKELESKNQAIIIDPDRFKMGEETEHGYFDGFTSLYKIDTDRERMQEPCGDAAKQVLDNVSKEGLNLILPKATTTLEKLNKQLQILFDRGYDVHLIQLETPLEECANRNYFRYLINEYKADSHGRFVPVSVIKNIGDQTFVTFARAMKESGKRYKSFKAFYNSKDTRNEEIDLETMYQPS